ncbi:MAG TPA: DUF3800 domain-containing protein [Blastocatellia bacterium]|nr:DUF3800 domain-containing protein [Blastocatellia bacterium]
MKFCYVDESGTGDEPVAVMVGVVVDSQRMHVTKEHWQELLRHLSEIINHELAEIHTRDFYSGNGIWRQMDGSSRTNFISAIFEWLNDRKHHIVYSSANKAKYYDAVRSGIIPRELNTIWRYLAFHLMLAIQKRYQKEKKNKGNTVFIFDNEKREEKRFIDLINNCPDWSDTYYGYSRLKRRIDQIIDAPYFGYSKEVGMIQVADFVAYFLRRYAEIREGLVPARYADEEEKVCQWVSLISSRTIGKVIFIHQKGDAPALRYFIGLPQTL